MVNVEKIGMPSPHARTSTGVHAPPLTTFWLFVWAATVSLSWLAPNHYPPWAAFHADAWMAGAMALASAAVILRTKNLSQLQGPALLVTALVGLPFIQYWSGLIPFEGQAWISTAYLLGLLLALLTAQRWEQAAPDQCINGLFLAIGIASILSVHLQLQTWLDVIDTGIFDFWSMGLIGERPYANLGQPNQLGTLLIWGLLACAWGMVKGKISAPTAVLLAAFLLFGIALTQSRTAWLGLSFIVAATWAWRRLWSSKWVPWGVTGLFAFFWTCPLILRWLNRILLLVSEPSYFRVHFEDETRHVAVFMLIQAIFERPWFGYGWTEIGKAQLAVAESFPAVRMSFAHSHNLFLDLFLWLGVPIGVFVSAWLLKWLWTCVRRVNVASDAILVTFIMVVGVHAMVEFPLHYAYFLLPAGMVMGALNHRLIGRGFRDLPRWAFVVLWIATASLLAVIVRDYLHVESSYRKVRFELARIGTQPVGPSPDVWLLTQWRERIDFLRYVPKPGMDAEKLNWMTQVASANPVSGALYKAATALALNDRPKEARSMLAKVCKIASAEECDAVRNVWAHDSATNTLIAAVDWPE